MNKQLLAAAEQRVNASDVPAVVAALQKKFQAKRIASSAGTFHLIADYHRIPSLEEAKKFMAEQGFKDHEVIGKPNDYGVGFILNSYNNESLHVAYCPDVLAFLVTKI